MRYEGWGLAPLHGIYGLATRADDLGYAADCMIQRATEDT